MLDGYTCVVTSHSPAVRFNILDGDLPRFAQPTVQDLLEYAAERHNADCGCDLKIGGRVWFTSIPLSKLDNCEWATMGHDPLPVNTSLRALPAAADPSTAQLVIAGEQSATIDYLRLYREKLFTPYRVEGAAAYKRFGASYALLPEKGTSFAYMCSTPGSVFVDKTRSILTIFELSLSRVNVIRRPKGFGKSTFLSMFDAFFDPLSAHAHFPFTFTQDISTIELEDLEQHSQLMVFALDFAQLRLDTCIGDDSLRAECERLLDAAAQRFYTRYQSYLKVSEKDMSRPGVSPTFCYVLRWAKLSGWKLCLTIDNYTAPFLDRRDPIYEDAISRHILAKLSALLNTRFMMYGLIVGDDVPYCSNWLGLSDIADDISNSPAFADVIGFTPADVEALGRAISVDLTGALESYAPNFSRTEKTRVYSPADVLSLAQHVLHPDGLHHAPLEVRTFPPDVPAKQEGHDAAESDDVVMYDDDYEPCHYFDDDYEGSENGSYIPTPAMTAASSSSQSSSSSGSSSTSPSGSSSTSPSGSSSKSPGKQLPFTIAEEPSSPLEAYGKKPWDSDEL